MVNLTFCRLDVFLIRSSLITPKHNIHLFPFISLQRDDHSCWNFFVDLLRTSDLALSKLHRLFGHLLFGFRYPGEIFSDLRVDQNCEKIMDHDSDLLDADGGIMEDFFKQPLASVQIMAVLSFELFGFFWFLRRILFTSVPLYYFDLKSDWLP